MAATPRAGQKAKRSDEIEFHPDAWERFTEFVKRIAKAGPQHRKAADKPKRPSKARKA
jgi:hypothetical protein